MSDTPPSTPSNWDDLTVRVTSGVAMLLVGGFGIIMGGTWFQMMVIFVTAVMIWELWMMIRPDGTTSAMLLPVGAAAVLAGQVIEPGEIWSFFAVPVIGAAYLKRERVLFFVFALGIQLAGWGLIQFRVDFGLTWILWMILVVVATDIFGYFAGRTFGGPKFWPKVSPKKTWSGTAAGWVAAGVVGACFAIWTDATWTIIPISMVLSFASQMGDIAESALKRRVGIKDSSTLIPGHGGPLDRFDALLGAALFMLLVIYVLNVPGLTF